MDAFDIYAEQLYGLNKGYALYEPDPAGQYDRVRIGDVGYTQFGYFHRAFNIFAGSESDDPINTLGVPEYFEPCPDIYKRSFPRATLDPGPIFSSSICQRGAGLQLSSV